ncbi:MAG: hypothetical protein JO291_12080 [Acidimicrobiia bacterium]|nr:hypothetical protein [Acidimicrobiia bacterium]
MKTVTVFLVAVLVSLTAGHTASAANAVGGTKVFKRDCTLNLEPQEFNEGLAGFFVTDTGAGCGDYLVRSISITTRSGYYSTTSLWDGDNNFDPRHEDLRAYGYYVNDLFLYGDAVVYVPYRARCDRYRLYKDGTVRYLESQPCSGTRYPPDVKVFKQDCAIQMGDEFERGGTHGFIAFEVGTECDSYVLRAVSEVSIYGYRAYNTTDYNPDPNLENIGTSVPVQMAYATLDVYIPSLSRCDRIRNYYPSKIVRYVDSRPCS